MAKVFKTTKGPPQNKMGYIDKLCIAKIEVHLKPSNWKCNNIILFIVRRFIIALKRIIVNKHWARAMR
ncbi:MAG: hypothetical protein MI866_01885 [Bacteroidales bacterium]|nr:hypothetical protein [Bacteroidales bacterium]